MRAWAIARRRSWTTPSKMRWEVIGQTQYSTGPTIVKTAAA
jgi:hypothetical protein